MNGTSVSDGCSVTVTEAIERSIRQHEIVHLDWDEGLARQFHAESEGGIDTSEVQEFWGEADGRAWRVHLDK